VLQETADVEETMLVEIDASLIVETPQMENSTRAENDLICAPPLWAASHPIDRRKNINSRKNILFRGGGKMRFHARRR
jgi:hypothetical protein